MANSIKGSCNKDTQDDKRNIMIVPHGDNKTCIAVIQECGIKQK
jgi:hypothetical protein